MNQFERAMYDLTDEQKERLIADCALLGFSRQAALETIHQLRQDPVYRNEKYQVSMRDVAAPGWPEMIWLSIKRIDKEPIHDWRDLQQIKNELIGPEHEGFELYPSEQRRVDSANQYHLFVFKDANIRIPVGFQERLVSDVPSIGGSKQRKLR